MATEIVSQHVCHLGWHLRIFKISVSIKIKEIFLNLVENIYFSLKQEEKQEENGREEFLTIVFRKILFFIPTIFYTIICRL